MHHANPAKLARISWKPHLRVDLNGLAQSLVKSLEILLGTVGAGGNGADDGKGHLVDDVLEDTEDSGDGRGERGGREEALLSDDGLEQVLVDLDKLR